MFLLGYPFNWKAAVLITGSLTITWSNRTLAQIIPDTTLGTEQSHITSNVQIRESIGDRIDGGAQRGANLFHSFQEFNVHDGQRVYFSNPIGVENIISRVTGTNVSEILGTLGVAGNANLFLLNPNGIIFGPNAQLDIAGSFTATTANAIQFGNQGFFDVNHPGSPPLLTVNPSAFWVSSLHNGDITNRSAAPAGVNLIGQPVLGLRVGDGETLSLLGGNVNLEGGRLNALGGRIEIAAVRENGAIGLNTNSSLSIPIEVERSNVTLTNGAVVDTTAAGGGEITIQAHTINLSGGSTITTGILPGVGGEGVRSGDIRLDATGSIVVRQSQLSANTFGRGDAGDIVLNADDTIQLVGDGRRTTDTEAFALFRNVVSNVEPGAIGNSGDIIVSARSIALTNRSAILAETWSLGNAGSIILRAAEGTTFNDGFAIVNVLKNAVGQAGQIDIQSRSLVFNTGTLDTSTFGRGNAGNIRLNIAGPITLRTANVSSSVLPNAIGDGGLIHIQARSLFLREGGVVSSITSGQGNAGNIVIQIAGPILLKETGMLNGWIMPNMILTAVPFGGTGRGGDIHISAHSLSMVRGGTIAAATFEQGRAGNITIHTRDFILLDGVDEFGASAVIVSNVGSRDEPAQGGDISLSTSRLYIMNGAIVDASSGGNSRSRGGEITIEADALTALNGGTISSSSSGGQAGSITVTVTGQILLSGRNPTFQQRMKKPEQISNPDGAQIVHNEGQEESGLFANTRRGSTGVSGDIFVRAEDVRIEDGATIAVNNQSGREGGNIEIQSDTLTLINRAQISAETVSGDGGEIVGQLSNYLLLRDRSNITTEAGVQRASGNGGNITINAPAVVAIPNEDSNINANAFRGNGGNITINTQSLLGLQPSEQPTPLSDITASSQFGLSGQISITTPDVNPTQRLVELPTSVIDPSRQIAQICSANSNEGFSEFIVTGRGGLPPNPTELLSDTTVLTPWVSAEAESLPRESSVSAPVPRPITSLDVDEAQGWIVDAKGTVALVSSSSFPTSTVPASSPIGCGADSGMN